MGFGTASMPGALTQREAFAVLDAALEAGVRHIDTARMYGYGETEAMLGAFLRERGASVTIATKAGIFPPSLWARAASKFLPSIDASPSAHRFAPNDVRASVEASLRKLKRERLDALLLHEIRVADVTPALKEALAALHSEGKIDAYGIATSVDDTQAIIAKHADICRIVQVPVQWLDRRQKRPPGSVLIVHSVLGARLAAFLDRLRDAQVARRFKDETGLGSADTEEIGQLLLQAAASQNPDGVTLFTTHTPDRIHGNMAAAAANLDGSAARIVERILQGPSRPARAVL